MDHLVTDPTGYAWRAIFDPPVNLYLWPRPARFSSMLEAWIAEAPVNAQLHIDDSGDARRGLAAMLAHWPGVENADCADWIADMAMLTERYRALANRVPVCLRLQTIDDEDGTLFHVDHHTVRLVCTYAGPGIQWLPDGVVARDQLGLRGRNVTAANSAIGPVAAIQDIPPGTVALLRGEGEPGREGRGIVHRYSAVRARRRRVRLTLEVREHRGVTEQR